VVHPLTSSPSLLISSLSTSGGTVLKQLLAAADPKLAITALVRTEEIAAKVKALGVAAVIGSIDDSPLLEKLGAEFNGASFLTICPLLIVSDTLCL